MSALGAERISDVELAWHRYGTSWARVSTDLAAVPTGPAVLIIGDLVLQGAVVSGRAGEDAPASWSGIWSNGTAWDTVLKARPTYQSDDGVRLKTVLKDLAADCGVILPVTVAAGAPPDLAVGLFWTRPKYNGDGSRRTGRDELNALVRARAISPWWIDALGVTRFDVRATGEVAAVSRVIARDLTIGMRRAGVDSPASFVPGGLYEGARMGRVIVRESDGKGFTVETWVK